VIAIFTCFIFGVKMLFLFKLDVWAGSMSTVALTTDNEVLVCGLNNYSQVIKHFWAYLDKLSHERFLKLYCKYVIFYNGTILIIFFQLGIEKKTEIFFLTKSPAFTKIAQENGT